MRVLVVHNHYQHPGGERQVVELEGRLLRDHGHEVLAYSRDNREIRQYNGAAMLGLAVDTIYSGRTVWDLKRVVARFQPDVAHVHNVFPLISPSAYRALSTLGVPVVQTVHNFRFLCSNGLFYTQGAICERCRHGNTLHAVRYKCYRDSYLQSLLYAASIGIHRRLGTFRMIDRYIALTPFSADMLVSSGLTERSRVAVVGNFCQGPDPDPDAGDSAGEYVAFLGRLSNEKGISVLLDAARLTPAIPYRIAGDGPLRAYCTDRVASERLHNVTLVRRVSGSEKWDFLSRASMVVIPSTCYEGFGLVVLESYLRHRPVVASNLGGLKYVVEDGKSGLMFTPGDPNELARCIRTLWDDRDSRRAMGEYGYRVAACKYSADAHYAGLMQVYSEVAG